ncbi:MAG: DUF5666 domain-containing protein [Candidatus Nanopelagicales bacterium]
MNRTTVDLQRLVLAIVAAGAMIVGLGSCGGGAVGSGGTGRAQTGQSVGTVNGFGSVIVDGVSYDVLGARVVSEVAPSVDVVAEIKLGERVSISYEAAGVAREVRIETTLSGPVADVSPSGLTVLGQAISINEGGGPGPRTQFGGGYVNVGDVSLGDSIDIYGVPVQGAPFYSIQATRIEKRADLPSFLRVTGVVSSVSRTNVVTFVLAGLTVDATNAAVLPSGWALMDGETVTLLAPLATLTQSSGAKPLVHAAQVRILKLESGGLEDIVSGSIAKIDVAAQTFFLGSLKVSYNAAVVMPVGTTLANRQYVKVEGALDIDGTLVATNVERRDGDSGNESTLRGNISAYDAVAKRLMVRDVLTDVGSATLEGCPAAGLSNGLFVEIEGSLSGNGVVARQIHCESESSGSTVEREGTATLVDVALRRFTLMLEHGALIVVQWSDKTFFGDVSPATLSGKKVEVEASLVEGVLQATKVKAED